MDRRVRAWVVLCVALLGLEVAARPQSGMEPLQGSWVVMAGEHNGIAMDSLNGGVMTIDGAGFEIRTASGNVLAGTLAVDASVSPGQVDLLHANGTQWDAVFEVDGDTLRLNYVDASGADPRPTGFKTLPTNEESLVVLRRQGQ